MRDEAWREVFDLLAGESVGGVGTPNGGCVAVKVEPGESVDESSGALATGVDSADGEAAFLEVIVNADTQHWRKVGNRKRASV
jgi:hypothetical protein